MTWMNYVYILTQGSEDFQEIKANGGLICPVLFIIYKMTSAYNDG